MFWGFRVRIQGLESVIGVQTIWQHQPLNLTPLNPKPKPNPWNQRTWRCLCLGSWGVGLRVSGLGPRVQGLGSKVQSLGSRV